MKFLQVIAVVLVLVTGNETMGQTRYSYKKLEIPKVENVFGNAYENPKFGLSALASFKDSSIGGVFNCTAYGVILGFGVHGGMEFKSPKKYKLHSHGRGLKVFNDIHSTTREYSCNVGAYITNCIYIYTTRYTRINEVYHMYGYFGRADYKHKLYYKERSYYGVTVGVQIPSIYTAFEFGIRERGSAFVNLGINICAIYKEVHF